MLELSIFISSPSDVLEERSIVRRTIERLNEQYNGCAILMPFFWEEKGFSAAETFQAQIPHPSEFDLCIFIFWSRLGTPLPAAYTRPEGGVYKSGTEFEFEDAINSARKKGIPDLLVYRKSGVPHVDLDEKFLEELEQRKALDAFFRKWFRGEHGSFVAGFNEFKSTAELEEKLFKHLRERLDERLAQIGITHSMAQARWHESPFRGLNAFDFEHRLIFFGRSQEASEILEQLRRQASAGRAFMLVLGMSGCGKSSLVRAGLLPCLVDPGTIEGVALWRRAVLKPSDAGKGNIFDGLSAALLSEPALPELRKGIDPITLAHQLAEAPDAIPPLIALGLSQAAVCWQEEQHLDQLPVARLILVVDQLEEIFGAERATPSERNAYAAVLAKLATSGSAWIVATLRSDFYHHCMELPALMALKKDGGQYDLTAPTPTEISQMIREPAEIAGLRFEQDTKTRKSLDQILLDAAASDPQSLPLLEFTLDQLYRTDGDQGILSFASYRAMGGMEGALAQHAEQVIDTLPKTLRNRLPDLFGVLIDLGLDEHSTPMRRRALMDRIVQDGDMVALVEHMCKARLLTMDRTERGEPVVAIAHEALLTHWPRLHAWLDENRKFLQSRARVEAAEALWRQEGQIDQYLLPKGSLLEEGKHLLGAHRAQLQTGEISYIELSIAAIDRAKYRLNVACLAAVLLIGSGLLIRWWFSYKDYVTYYASFTRKDGVPIGIGPTLSTETLRHRFSAIKLVKQGQGGEVKSISLVNSYGECAAQRPVGSYLAVPASNDFAMQSECRYSLHRGHNGEIKEEAYDQEDRLVRKFYYDPKDPKGIGRYTDKQDVTRRNSLGVIRVHITRSADGFETKRIYVDSTGKEVPDIYGSFGEQLQVNEAGLPVQRVNLGYDGRAARSKDGYVRMALQYNTSGNIVDIALHDKSNQLTRDRDGLSHLTISYDDYGNETERTYLDPSGAPVRTSSGYAKVKSTYRFHDHESEMVTEYFDESGRPTLDQNGVAKWTVRYNEKGNETERKYFDTKGHLSLSKEGYAKVKFTYNQSGDRVEQAYYDTSDHLFLSKNGYAKVKFGYDEDGNKTEQAYFDENDRRTLSKDGYARVKFEYERGNQRAESYFDESEKDERPTRNNDGYSTVTFEYTRGNQTMRSYRDERGELIRNKDGYAIVRFAYDDRRNQTRAIYFSEEGARIPIKDGYSMIEFRYDELGNETERTYFDVANHPIRSSDGYAKVKFAYDERGRQSEQAYFDELGRPIRSKDGYAKVKFRYDERGRRSEQAYLDESDRPIRSIEGYAKISIKYDDRGNQREQSYFDEEGKSMRSTGGYAKVTFVYDERGNPTEQAYFDEANHPVVSNYGYAKTKIAYDPRDNRTEQAYFDDNSFPMRIRDGYAKVKHTYDKRGNQVALTYYSEADHVTRIKSGYAGIAFRYDNRGHLIEQVFFDEADRPVLSTDGYMKVTYEYDESGNRRETAYFAYLDGEYKRVLTSMGYSRQQVKYDFNGNLVSEIRYDANNKVIPRKDGCAWEVAQYDSLGNKIGKTCVDAGENPVRSSYGYVRTAMKYNDGGDLIEESYLNEAGQLTTGPAGYARKTISQTKDPAQGYEFCEVNYLDVTQRLTLASEGYAREVSRSWKEGANFHIETEFYDQLDHLVAPLKVGFARGVMTCDEKNKVIKEMLLDAHNKEIGNTVAISKIIPKTQSESLGVRVGDIIVSLQDIPIQSLSKFKEIEKMGAGSPRGLSIKRNGRVLHVRLQPGPIGVDVDVRPRSAAAGAINKHAGKVFDPHLRCDLKMRN